MCSGYPFTAQTRARDTPVLPPVYSTTEPPGLRRPSDSAASIMASAIRSFMLPVGFSFSSFTRMRALFLGRTLRRGSKRVLPMHCRMFCGGSVMLAVTAPRNYFHAPTYYVYTYIYGPAEATAKDSAYRCPRAGPGLRRLDQTAGGATHHPVPRQRDGEPGPHGGTSRDDGPDRHGFGRHAGCARPPHGSRTIDDVAQPAHARGRRA